MGRLGGEEEEGEEGGGEVGEGLEHEEPGVEEEEEDFTEGGGGGHCAVWCHSVVGGWAGGVISEGGDVCLLCWWAALG